MTDTLTILAHPVDMYFIFGSQSHDVQFRFSCDIFIWFFVIKIPVNTDVYRLFSSSPSRARTYNPSVNSRMLYHWAIEEYQYFPFLRNCTFKTSYRLIKCRHYAISHLLSAFGQALGRLVSVSSMHRCTSTPDLSTSYSLRVLTTFVGTSHLGGGFTLRCLQRLSLPDLATQLCHWYDNWCTSGLSSPVLSY